MNWKQKFLLNRSFRRIRLMLEDIQRKSDCAYYDESLAGLCKLSTYLQGLYMESQGFGNWSMVEGKFDISSDLKHPVSYNRLVHAWLEIEGYIVDLTATQFGIRKKIFWTPNDDKRYLHIMGFKSLIDWYHYQELDNFCLDLEEVYKEIRNDSNRQRIQGFSRGPRLFGTLSFTS